MYRANTDPWGFGNSPYEQAKYTDTVAALPKASYESAFEVDCSLGVLTQLLATRCQHLLAVDIAEVPLERAASVARSCLRWSFGR